MAGFSCLNGNFGRIRIFFGAIGSVPRFGLDGASVHQMGFICDSIGDSGSEDGDMFGSTNMEAREGTPRLNGPDSRSTAMDVTYPEGYEPRRRRFSVSSESYHPEHFTNLSVRLLPKTEVVRFLFTSFYPSPLAVVSLAFYESVIILMIRLFSLSHARTSPLK